MKKRIIPRLEIKGPNLVKGVQLDGLRIVGNPRDFARKYYEDGADELIYIDIVASLYNRRILPDIIRDTAKDLFIPLTVGGGIRSLQDIEELLNAGADKVAINSAATREPSLIDAAAKRFGSQCIVLATEVKKIDNSYEPYIENGREPTGRNLRDWIREGIDRGAGEVLVTSVDKEGLHTGYDIEMLNSIGDIPVPLLAAGGAGSMEDVRQALAETAADAVCASSLFHYHYINEAIENSQKTREGVSFNREMHYFALTKPTEEFEPCSIPVLKEFLSNKNIDVRKNDAN